MKKLRRRKCLCCQELFRPDPRNLRHQRYCSKPHCRKASKAASQQRWLSKKQNRDYFRGAAHVQRVQAWRREHPGYWRRHGGIRVAKFRGSGFANGYHDMCLNERGMSVFPALIPDAHERRFKLEMISSGIPEIDELLAGGIERGTTTIISGPSGVGKSTLGMQFMKEAAGRGERSVIYAFEEGIETLLERCEGVNIPAHVMIERGTLSVVKVEPLKYTPSQFVHLVRSEVEQQNARIVMIDSTSGYKLSMEGEDLIRQLHALCQYLKNMGVTVILVNEVHSIAGGEFSVTEIGLSYLSDNLIFLRYLELGGQLRKAIGVLKKRVSNFERSLREFTITKYGIKVGEPLTQLRGILTGIPEWVDRNNDRQ